MWLTSIAPVSAIRLTSTSTAASLVLGAAVLGAGLLADIGQARAEILSISATGLVRRCPCGVDTTANDIAEEDHGVFVGDTPSGRYFVPVVFPVTTGQKICSFSMVYQDTNQQDTMTAHLYRKAFSAGSDPFSGRTVIAAAKSASGTQSTTRVAMTTSISSPTIEATQHFYYIEVDVPTTNLNLIGFQILYKPTC